MLPLIKAISRAVCTAAVDPEASWVKARQFLSTEIETFCCPPQKLNNAIAEIEVCQTFRMRYCN